MLDYARFARWFCCFAAGYLAASQLDEQLLRNCEQASPASTRFARAEQAFGLRAAFGCEHLLRKCNARFARWLKRLIFGLFEPSIRIDVEFWAPKWSQAP